MNLKTHKYLRGIVSSQIDDVSGFVGHVNYYASILCNSIWTKSIIDCNYLELHLVSLVITFKFNVAYDYETERVNINHIENINKIKKNRLKELELIILTILNWHPFDIRCMYA